MNHLIWRHVNCASDMVILIPFPSTAYIDTEMRGFVSHSLLIVKLVINSNTWKRMHPGLYFLLFSVQY